MMGNEKKLYVMEFKILNVETITDELSLDDLKGGLNSMGTNACNSESADCNINCGEYCPENEVNCDVDF